MNARQSLHREALELNMAQQGLPRGSMPGRYCIYCHVEQTSGICGSKTDRVKVYYPAASLSAYLMLQQTRDGSIRDQGPTCMLQGTVSSLVIPCMILPISVPVCYNRRVKCPMVGKNTDLLVAKKTPDAYLVSGRRHGDEAHARYFATVQINYHKWNGLSLVEEATIPGRGHVSDHPRHLVCH